MSCFSCFSGSEKKEKQQQQQQQTRSRSLDQTTQQHKSHVHPDQPHDAGKIQSQPLKGLDIEKQGGGGGNIAAQTFTFRELAAATKNFRQESLIGEGGFGRVYKGVLERTGQIVGVKQLDRNGLQGNKEFLVEVLMLSHLNHENLVNLIGYCADGDQRLLVYEFMSLGSVEDHLLDISPEQKPLDWCTRMKIAYHAVKGLEYLHEKANPPVIYRDMKSSNILLDEDYNAKLSDFGLAKLGPVGDTSHVSSRIMGTYGYCAPEYQRTGRLTVKTDIYSFGVVLLELITGMRAIDINLRGHEQLLVTRVEAIFKDPNRYHELADPLLNGDFPRKGLNQAVAVAAMCLHEDPSCRPFTSDIVTALSYLWVLPDEPEVFASQDTPTDDDVDREDELSAQEREEAIAEAMKWGSTSRNQTNNSNFILERQNVQQSTKDN